MKKNILLSLVFSLFFVLPTYAADWYVHSEKGDDLSICNSADNPCQSIHYVLGEMQGGDTVYFMDSPTESFTIQDSLSGSEEAMTTITAVGNDIVINGSSMHSPISIEADYVKISGFTIENTTTGTGISINQDTYAVIIDGMQFNDNHTGISTQGEKTMVINSFFYNNEYDISFQLSENTLVGNNSFFNAQEANFTLTMVESANFLNNIFHTSPLIFQSDSNSGAMMTLDYNDYFNYTDFIYYTNRDEGQTQEEFDMEYKQNLNSFSEDPKYILADAGNTNLHISSDSPCIDMGQTMDSYNKDFDGENRPLGGAYDIGADEIIVMPTPDNLSFDPKVKSMTLSWLADSEQEVTGYEVTFGTTEDLTGDDTTKTTISEAVLEVEDLVQAKKYYYSVKSYYTPNGEEKSYYSDTSEIATVLTKPKKVSTLKVKKKNRQATQVKATWKTQKRVSYIYRLYNGNGTELIKKGTIQKGKNKKIIKNLTPNTKYTLKMKARKKLDNIYYKSPKWRTVKFRTAAE